MKRIATLIALFSLPVFHVAQAQNGWDYFDGNNVEALISPVANHFWDYNDSQFFVPKDSSTTSIFTSTLWIGGLDDQNNLHLAAERYRQVGVDYTPGPVSDPGVYNPPFNGSWNNVWKVERSDLDQWLANPYTNAAPSSATNWPGNGNISLGQDHYLAPFADANGDGQYDPLDFDHPRIKGDQALFFLFNDDATVHTESGGNKMGVEVHGMAYGFDCPQDTALNHALFMEYTIYNRSANDYHDVYIGLWNDMDLGNPNDDYIGSDPMRNLFYVYNGDEQDEDNQGKEGYGFNLPAQGVRLLQGPKLEANNLDDQPNISFTGNMNGFGMGDGIVDNEELGFYSTMYMTNGAGATGDPNTAIDYYNFMQAIWKDGTPLSYEGGYQPNDTNTTPSRFMFSHGSDSTLLSTGGVIPGPLDWPVTAGQSTDYRALGSIGPLSLDGYEENVINPNTSITFTIVYVFAQKMNDRLGAVTKMKEYSDHLQHLFNTGTTPCGDFEKSYFPLPALGVEEATEAEITVFPNPTKDQFMIQNEALNTSFTLQSVSGQTVKTGFIGSANETVNTSDLDAGVYLLSIESGDTQRHQRVVIR